MTLSKPDTVPYVSLARLSLKRFVKGTLQSAGIALASLIIVLHLGTPAPAHTPPAIQPAHTSSRHIETAQLSKHPPSVHALKPAQTSASTADHTEPYLPSSPALILKASMTQHHLTRARLTIPTLSAHPMVSMAEDK